MADKPDNQTLLVKFQKWFTTAEEVSNQTRKNNERDRSYYDGDQWTPEELEVLADRNQPPIVVNRIKPKIDTLTGIERLSRTDPKAVPRNPVDDADSASATDILRYIKDNNKFDKVKSEAFEQLCIEGTAVGKLFIDVILNEDDEPVDFDIRIKSIPYDRIFIDPHSREKDASDAKYIGEVLWMDFEEALETWPGKKDALEKAKVSSTNEVNTAYKDFPNNSIRHASKDTRNALFFDNDNDRIRVIEIWYRIGKKTFNAVFIQGEFIQEPKKSPFKDSRGRPITPYVIETATINRKTGDRYGYVRQLIDVQDEINKRRSKALHLISQKQLIINKGSAANIDIDTLRSEMVKADGVLQVDGAEIEILSNTEMAAGNVAMLQDAKFEIDNVGFDKNLQGGAGSSASGRAVQLNQQAGSMEVSYLFDAIKSWQLSVYEIAWDMVKQFWTEEKHIRVSDRPDSVRFVGVNVQETDENGEMTGRIANEVGVLDVDITITEAPDTADLQAESFNNIIQLLKSSGQQISPVWLELMIQASPLRDKEQILARLAEEKEQGSAAANAAQEAQLEGDALEKNSVIAKNNAKAMLDTAKAQEVSEGSVRDNTKLSQEILNSGNDGNTSHNAR